MIPKKIKVVGINGFGRFGLHLLRYWLDRKNEAMFSVQYINDDTLTGADIINILRKDRYVRFGKKSFTLRGENLVINGANNLRHFIKLTNSPSSDIPWIGRPHFFLECSGKHDDSKTCKQFVTGNTRLVVISATSWNADKTLIYGFNHLDFSPKNRVISYGSCTVNAYVPLANYVNNNFGVAESDVNVIHNIAEYRLKDPSNYTILRKTSTLQKSACNLLGFLTEKNFLVNYTIVPYTGVSMLDVRFRVNKPKKLGYFLDNLKKSVSDGGELEGLYTLDQIDRGAEKYIANSYSAVFIEKSIRILGDNVYMHGYFDNENSVNRYFDLVQYLASSYTD